MATYGQPMYGAQGGMKQPLYQSATGGYAYSDLESGQQALFPGITVSDQTLRWGFIRKVYGILCAQMVLTAITCATIMFDPRVQTWVIDHPAFLVASMIIPLVGLLPLWCYRQQHPINLILLAGWTVSISIGVGLVCSSYPSIIVLEALVLTAGITTGLTVYTFVATKQGKEFERRMHLRHSHPRSFLGPWLFSCLFGLVVFGFVAMFFPMGPIGSFVYALLGAVLFSAYVVYDTFDLIKRHSVDEYVWASVGLYLDILNLFLYILEILGGRNRD